MGGTIYAVRFDPRRLETAGTPVAILEGVMRAPVGMSAASQFAVSADGLLAYIAGPTTGAADRYDLSLVNRRGEASPLKLPPGPYESPRVSRDGKWIAFGSEDSSGAFVLVYNLDGKTAPRRLTFNGKNRLPIWTADSKRVVFQSDHEGDLALFWQAVDGSGKAERLTKPASGEEHIPDDCSSDGDTCLFTVLAGGTYSLWSLSLRDRRTAPVAGVVFSAPSGARFSPDGRWIAYAIRDRYENDRGRTVPGDWRQVSADSKAGRYSAPPDVVSRWPGVALQSTPRRLRSGSRLYHADIRIRRPG